VRQSLKRVAFAGAFLAIFSLSAWAGEVAVGYMSWDVDFPGNAGQFDVTNNTGANSTPYPDPTFPIASTLLFDQTSLNLSVDFTAGPSASYGPGTYFSTDLDGQSLDGTAIPIGGTNPEPIDATLTGNFLSTSITLNDGSTATILPGFSVTVSDTDPNLVDGDLAVIYATIAPSGVPEPSTWMLFSLGLGCILISRSTRLRNLFKMNRSMIVKAALPVLCLVIAQAAAFGQVKLNVATSPSSGVAGVNNVNLTGSGFPAGTITPANVMVTFAASCGGAAVQTESANSVITILGSEDRVNINLPLGLTSGLYYVSIADSGDGSADFTSTDCSEVKVTATSAILNACVAGSSLGVLLPAGGAAGTVTAYVPKGAWCCGSTGIDIANIEGTPAALAVPPTALPTTSTVNSCSSNPATGQTVCVANNTNVYLMHGTAFDAASPLASGSNQYTGFSGGSCYNCGVAVNASNNTAVINMGLGGGNSGSGVQILNLTNNTFNAAFPMNKQVSENISVNPTRSLVLTADEQGQYVLDQIQANGSLIEYDPSFPGSGFEDDSSAEDCSTGIAIAPGEFTNSLQLVNLNSITFTPPGPPSTVGTYTALQQNFTLVTDYGFSAGLSGSAVAQGSGHLALVTGEFGGNTFAVLQLQAAVTPTTVPTVVDYAVAAIPAATAANGGTDGGIGACSPGFSAGYDPHTMTAYTSPNTGHSYAVFANYNATCLAVVDMTAVLAAPRAGGGLGAHDVAAADLPATALSFFDVP